ncbi:unnamed protein product, partial [Schistosoma rodhaini]|uniref:40S ribosomal protein S21 n=1 Tax=Schistosoma rodhaini TaxID=6188 RepID=A0AA85FQV1_9TREM
MQNEAGEFVDIYIPRRCAVTNRLIGAKDHASIQIQFVDLDPTTGRMIGGSKKTYDLSGSIRSMRWHVTTVSILFLLFLIFQKLLRKNVLI